MISALAAGLGICLAMPLHASAAKPTPLTVRIDRVCSAPAAGMASCQAERRVLLKGSEQVAPAATPSGYGPADIQSAYNLPSLGAGQTVAIVDAYDLPTAASDLNAYRSQYGLPACTVANGCFRKVNQTGATSPLPPVNGGWGVEISLDMDMVSAACPLCKILLVEAQSPSYANLGTAVNTAVAMGARAVSLSWSGAESVNNTTYDNTYFKHPGVAIVAASGDAGYGTQYPASSPWVTAVGGTRLVKALNARGWSETAWNGAGSGCSVNEAKPSYQTDPLCPRRAETDVSAVADPNTGVAVYNTTAGSGWATYGGTSAATPIIASIYAMANAPGAGVFPAQYPYGNTGALNDVTGGFNGSCGNTYLCTAKVGYDGPTGLGTPNGVAAFGPGGIVITDDFSINVSPNSASVTAGDPASTPTVSTATTQGSAQSVSLSNSSLPAGVTVGFSPPTVTSGNSSTMTVATTSSTPAGSYPITITGTGSSATHSTTFTLTVASSGGGGGGGGGGGAIVNGGFETGTFSGWTTAGTTSVTTINPHTGTRAALVGRTSPSSDSSIAQTFTVPAGVTQVSFWYRMSCGSNVLRDWATATLKDVTTSVTTTVLPRTCATNASYVKVTAGVVAGDTYLLTLANHDDTSLLGPSSTRYDDVALS